MNIPIIENAAFAYGTFESWREVALGEKPGDIYSRNSNPTIRALNEKMAALEGAEAATDFSTGMAAINTTQRVEGPSLNGIFALAPET
jgi:cystathionine gamma-synthase